MKEIAEILRAILIELRGRRDIMSIKDAARYYDVSERSIRRLITHNSLISVRVPGLGLMVDTNSLNNIIRNQLDTRKEQVEIECRTSAAYSRKSFRENI